MARAIKETSWNMRQGVKLNNAWIWLLFRVKIIMSSFTPLLNVLLFITLPIDTLALLPFSQSYSFYHYPRTALSSTTLTSLHNNSLIDWLITSGCNPSIQHSVRIDTNGLGVRGLFAQRDLAKDEVIFELPNRLALEVGDTLRDGESGMYLIGSDFDGVDCGERVRHHFSLFGISAFCIHAVVLISQHLLSRRIMGRTNNLRCLPSLNPSKSQTRPG